MAEIAVSRSAGDELVALGLGSCIGLAIVDRLTGLAGLAHIVLPDSHGAIDNPGKFADLAVPELLRQLAAAGGVQRRYEVAIAGGARMFEMSGGMDIGARNADAVKAALGGAGLSVRTAETGGNQGRTVRVLVGECLVTSRVAGSPAMRLLPTGTGRLAAVGAGGARSERGTLHVAGART